MAREPKSGRASGNTTKPPGRAGKVARATAGTAKPGRAKRAAAKSAAARSGATKRGAPKAAAARVRAGRREDYGKSVDAFVAKLPREVRPLVEQLRSLVLAAEPRAEEAIKWGMPVYQYQGMLCAISPARGYTRLQFYKKIEDPAGLLEGTGKNGAHVKVRKLEDIRSGLFTALIRNSAKRNEE